MVNFQRKVVYILMLSSSLLVSCTSGLDPLPSDIQDLTLSLSIPVGKVEVGLTDTYPIGTPNYWLNQNVPAWAKYEEIYYNDTVTVNLSKVYEKSSTISELTFIINIWNEFTSPVTANISFADTTSSTLFQFDPIEIVSGRIIQNDVIYSGFTPVSITINDQEQINKLKTAEYLIFYIKIDLKHPNSNRDFEYWTNFKITCQIGARVNFTLNNL